MWRNVDILQAIAFKNSTQGGSKERENQRLTCERILRERERERERGDAKKAYRERNHGNSAGTLGDNCSKSSEGQAEPIGARASIVIHNESQIILIVCFTFSAEARSLVRLRKSWCAQGGSPHQCTFQCSYWLCLLLFIPSSSLVCGW